MCRDRNARAPGLRPAGADAQDAISADDSTRLSAREIATAVSSGCLDAVAVAEAFLARIAERNGALNALVCIDVERTLQEAADVGAAVAAGGVLPLAGVPLVVKDNIWVKGWNITQGSRLFADFIAPQDADAVARARAAGAVVIGIGACSEFACKGVTTTPLHGVTHHPLDLSLTPGGSSGGNAAALAAGFAPIALGTDAGGSSRRPPAHCGIVGLKPSQDMLPYGPGFEEPSLGVSVPAPMGRTVDDAALLFDVLAEGGAVPLGREHRIGFSARFGLDVPVEPEVEAAVKNAVAALRAAGWHIRDVDVRWPDGVSEEALMPLQHAGLAALYGGRWRAQPDLFDPAIGAQIESGLSLSGVAVARARETSLQLRTCMDAVFRDVDILIGPTVPCVAWPHTQPGPSQIAGKAVPPRAHAVFTPYFNHARVPALSLPCGAGRNDLPVGLQIVGACGADRHVLTVARAAEEVFKQAELMPVKVAR